MSSRSLDDIIDAGLREWENGEFSLGPDVRAEIEQEKQRESRDGPDERDADERDERGDEPEDRDTRDER